MLRYQLMRKQLAMKPGIVLQKTQMSGQNLCRLLRKSRGLLSTLVSCLMYFIALVCHETGSPYSITEHRVLEPVLGNQPAGDVSHKPGSRLPLLSARPAVTPTTLKRAATSFAAW